MGEAGGKDTFYWPGVVEGKACLVHERPVRSLACACGKFGAGPGTSLFRITREGKTREGKGWEEKGLEKKGRDGKGREEKGSSKSRAVNESESL